MEQTAVAVCSLCHRKAQGQSPVIATVRSSFLCTGLVQSCLLCGHTGHLVGRTEVLASCSLITNLSDAIKASFRLNPFVRAASPAISPLCKADTCVQDAAANAVPLRGWQGHLSRASTLYGNSLQGYAGTIESLAHSRTSSSVLPCCPTLCLYTFCAALKAAKGNTSTSQDSPVPYVIRSPDFSNFGGSSLSLFTSIYIRTSYSLISYQNFHTFQNEDHRILPLRCRLARQRLARFQAPRCLFSR